MEENGWHNYYKKRCIKLPEAINKIKSGYRIVVGHAAGEPSALLEALVADKNRFKDVEIVHMVCLGKGLYCSQDMEGHFRHNALFVSNVTRDAINNGRGDFTPCFFSEIPKLFSEGYLPVDIALIQVSPPDKHGSVSLGVSVDYTKSAARNAKTVIAQVNEYMPRTLGDSFLNVKDIDYFVENSAPLIELGIKHISDTEKAKNFG